MIEVCYRCARCFVIGAGTEVGLKYHVNEGVKRLHLENLQECDDRLDSSGVTDDSPDLPDTVDTLIAGDVSDIADAQLAADAVALQVDGVHSVGNIGPAGVEASLAACRVFQLELGKN